MKLRARWDRSKFVEKLQKRADELRPVIEDEIGKYMRIRWVRGRRAWPVDTGYTRDGLEWRGRSIVNTASDSPHIWWRGSRAWETLIVTPVKADLPKLRSALRRRIVRYLRTGNHAASAEGG